MPDSLEREEETDTETRICYQEKNSGGEHEVVLKQRVKLDMTFASSFESYEADKKLRIKSFSKNENGESLLDMNWMVLLDSCTCYGC